MKLKDKKSIEQCAGKNDTRFYLNNPYLDAENKRLVATNGHCLAVVPVELSEGDTSGPVSADALKAARKTLAVFNPDLNGEAELVCNDQLEVTDGPTFPRPSFNGNKYPDIDAVVPDKKGRICVGVRVQYLADVAKAIADSKHGGVKLWIDPENSETVSILLEGENGAYGVVMPMRL